MLGGRGKEAKWQRRKTKNVEVKEGGEGKDGEARSGGGKKSRKVP